MLNRVERNSSKWIGGIIIVMSLYVVWFMLGFFCYVERVSLIIMVKVVSCDCRLVV